MVKPMAILAYVLFKVASGTERDVAQKLIEFNEVNQADIVFGEYDVIAEVTIENLEKLEEFVSTEHQKRSQRARYVYYDYFQRV